MRGRTLFGCGLFAGLACAVALVRADAPWRVSLVQPKDSELITRIEGQTRDLGVQLEVVPDTWRDGSAARALRVAAERGADFVVRVHRTRGGALEVHVYDARLRSVRARRLPAPKRKGRLATSAELEAAAIMLRGELNALIQAQSEAEAEAEARAAEQTRAAAAAGGGSGSGGAGSGSSTRARGSSTNEGSQERPQPTAAGNAAAPADVDAAVDEREPEPEPEPEPDVPLENYSVRQETWTLRGGLRGSIPVDGVTALGAFLGARAQLEWFELGLVIGTSLPFERSARGVRIQLQRSSLTAEAAGVLPWGPRLRLLLGVDAGVVVYARSTEAVPPGFLRRDSEPAWSAILGAQAELQWLVARQFGLALGLGVSYVPRETRFAYTEDPIQPLEIAALRTLEPWLCAGIFGLFGP